MKQEVFDFYDKTNLKYYNLDKNIRYHLNLLDTLDVYTRKHSENVASIVCRLCKYLHCSKTFTVYCTICAYLHDVGKIFIPPEILQKNGKLTNEEYEIMKTHVMHGYKMCMSNQSVRGFANGPLYHHEALNGTGYPNGFTKDDIPYEGQIIRVADEFDAIVNKRQYKSHVGISDTLKILIENSNPSPKFSSYDKNSPQYKYGKNNKTVVKALLKVVIDDIEYEIYCIYDYVNELKDELKRFELIRKYHDKMLSSKDEKTRKYYLEGMKILFKDDENIDNYLTIYQEYKDAFAHRKSIIDNLYKEIKVIKKLKV